jgi:tRNA/tmRNA/rRNA uracil-C5-methylase (TrmA/RlmC/RlmD family)
MSEPKNLQIVDMDHHRNGVGGMPFKVALVDDPTQGDTKLVIMFEAEGHTAVLSLDKLIQNEDISFGSNSWRGDQYEAALRPLMWSDED